MTIDFSEQEHRYWVDGNEVPSVTQVIRFLSIDQAVGADPAMRAAAAERGTRIHSACCDYDFDHMCDVDGDITGWVEGYAKFLRDYQVDDWTAQEKIVAGDIAGLRMAGTIDRVGIVDGDLMVIDIKTGSKIHEAPVSAQTVAYALMYEQMTGEKVVKTAVLHLNRKGGYTFKTLPWMYGERCLRASIKLEQLLKEKSL